MMDWRQWKPIYGTIVERLRLDPEEDRKATRLLTHLLRETSPDLLMHRLRGLIKGQSVIVCGAGPSLENHLLRISSDLDLKKAVLVAADGAAEGMACFDMKPDVVVTDLDGDRGTLRQLAESGAVVIVHAHGDNMALVRRITPILPPVLGSTQVEPTDRAFLWGGFTDGDRACYVVAEYEPSMIILAGMDFGDYVGKWSKPDSLQSQLATENKREKLRIGQELLEQLIASSGIKFTKL